MWLNWIRLVIKELFLETKKKNHLSSNIIRYFILQENEKNTIHVINNNHL